MEDDCNLIDSLNENGIHVFANKQFDAFAFDFSEHDNKVTEEKDKEIERLKNQIEKLNHEKMILRTRCKLGIEKDFDKGLFGKLAIVGCNEEFTDIQNRRMSELEDRHQSDCIEIDRLNVALEVMTEKYMKLREVHGLR